MDKTFLIVAEIITINTKKYLNILNHYRSARSDEAIKLCHIISNNIQFMAASHLGAGHTNRKIKYFAGKSINVRFLLSLAFKAFLEKY